MRFPPTTAVALLTAHDLDRARRAEYTKRVRRARPDEAEPTRRRRTVWARAARALRAAAGPVSARPSV
jgi:hypothetical protein